MKKILLVDDDKDFVESTRTILEEEFEVVVAYDGDEGVAKAKEVKPDLIILDIIMPVEDGFSAAEEIAGDDAINRIPLMLLTSFGQKGVETNIPRSRGMDVSADDYVEKPVDPDVLLAKVKALLG
jgi:two-component system alkaline phosphatase synthesis response regulator PhoP